MGSFKSLKITDQELADHGMTSLSGTKWTNQAVMLKAKLDEDGTFVAGKLGQVLDAMEAPTAAASFGADVPSVATKNVQAVLTAFESGLAARYTSAQADALVATNTNDLVKTVTFNDQDGKFTITKKDGTAVVIDTVLEKVPVSMVFETVGGVTRIKLTNQDGSTSFADVSSLVDGYTFNNTDTVALITSGVGNKKVVSASIRNASVTLPMLALDSVTQLETYVATAGSSATSASNSATSATGSATTATTKASDAAASATTATNKAGEALTSAADASASKTSAETSKNTAVTKASEASASAVSAAISASTSNTAKDAAQTAATSASTAVNGFDAKVTEANTTIDAKVSTATTKATESSNSAAAATASAANTASNATTCTTKASEASASAAIANAAATSSGADSNKSKSYAVGATGTRVGEDTDNSKYWCEQSRAIATGDVPTRTEAQGYVATHSEAVLLHKQSVGCVQLGLGANAEGYNTVAARENAHTEGEVTYAGTKNAHAEGRFTFAAAGTAYKITAFDNVAKTLTFDRVTSLLVNDVLIIRVSDALAEEVTVSAINGLVVSVITTSTMSSGWTYAVKRPTGTVYTAHAEGSNTVAISTNAHAEGSNTVAMASGSHAEGSTTTASGSAGSHAEGSTTTASGPSAHAEGYGTTASGSYSHSEGSFSLASGMYSHAQNSYTTAQGYSQTAVGEYNVAQGGANSKVATDHALIVGNGTSDAARSNAMSLTWEGTLDVAKDVKVNGSSLLARITALETAVRAHGITL